MLIPWEVRREDPCRHQAGAEPGREGEDQGGR